MTIEDLQSICKKLKGVTEDIKWEDHLCFNIGGKMFLVTAPDHVPNSASFKVPDDEFDEYCSKKGIIPAPYMARHKWVHLDDIKRLSKKQWEKAITTSYELVSAKLSVKLKKEIGLK
ncbi:MAG: MmcQ/YjbR family DNA-binding protein [Bacteroidetes bacterium]|nr:MmcQ/YjbR family DNA-binding protein [Bacteroidota bacterium]